MLVLKQAWQRAHMPIGRFLKCRSAVAFIEFSLIVPIMALLLVAIVELGNYWTLERRTRMAADAMASVLAQFAAQSLTVAERDRLMATLEIVSPRASRQKGNFAVGISSMTFDPVNPADCLVAFDCARSANVLWRTLEQGQLQGVGLRDCDVTIVENGQPPAPDAVPAGVVGPLPVVVVDLVQQFEPVFANGILPSLNIRASIIQTTRDGLPLRFQGQASIFESCA